LRIEVGWERQTAAIVTGSELKRMSGAIFADRRRWPAYSS
jgi:hypothetical protein